MVLVVLLAGTGIAVLENVRRGRRNADRPQVNYGSLHQTGTTDVDAVAFARGAARRGDNAAQHAATRDAMAPTDRDTERDGNTAGRAAARINETAGQRTARLASDAAQHAAALDALTPAERNY